MNFIGVMSGTSCDGIDVVMLDVEDPDRRHEPRIVHHAYAPYPTAVRRELLEPARLTVERVAGLHFELAGLYADAIRLVPGYADAAGCGAHGQTVYHLPPSRSAGAAATLQLGCASALSQHVGLPVVGDLRAADIALGGEGAPIVPYAHWLFTPPERAGRLVVNVGGIANFTHVTERLDEVTASDIGPGMMVADAISSIVTDDRLACDRDGELSRGGEEVRDVIEHVLAHAFFERPAPRSTGREDFGLGYARDLLRRFAHLRPGDLLCSVLAATATTIARTAHALSATEILLTGGGSRNPTLVECVRKRTHGAAVHVPTSGVFAPDHHEPAAMALIAARTLKGLPSSLPRVTGARRSAILGCVALPG